MKVITMTQSTAIQDARLLVQAEFQAVDDLIIQNLESKVGLIQEVGQYLLQAGGKRIRPLVLLLIAKACGHFNKHHLTLGAIIEFIHSATLLHDDVVDDSSKRRGKPSANRVWGNPTSVLVGDFLHSRAYQMINSVRDFSLIDILAETINMLSEGEVVQLEHRKNPDLTETQYNWIIHCKTGTLFKAAGLLGAAYNENLANQLILGEYGMHLGCAFQLMDDVMDYQSDPEVMGKNIGDDLKEGKMTLPLLHALQKATPAQAQIIRSSIQEATLKDLSAIQDAIASTGAIEYTMEKAQAHASAAISKLNVLSHSVYKTALINLTNFSIRRAV